MDCRALERNDHLNNYFRSNIIGLDFPRQGMTIVKHLVNIIGDSLKF